MTLKTPGTRSIIVMAITTGSLTVKVAHGIAGDRAAVKSSAIRSPARVWSSQALTLTPTVENPYRNRLTRCFGRLPCRGRDEKAMLFVNNRFSATTDVDRPRPARRVPTVPVLGHLVLETFQQTR